MTLLETVSISTDITLYLQIGVALFFATIVVRVAGFGGSLFAMPLITPIIGVLIASPVMALFNITNFGIVISQYWRELTFQDIWRNIVGAILFIPVGIWILYLIPEDVLRFSLGIFVITYALYRLLNLPFPKLKSPHWGWVAGCVAGITSGAFTLGGVPTVIYADTQDWEVDRFRLNMFTFFLVTGVASTIIRYVAGQITWQVVAYWAFSLPFMIAGLYVGTQLAKRVNRELFRRLVLLLLVVLGGRLIGSAF